MLWNVREIYVVLPCAGISASKERAQQAAGAQTQKLCSKCSEVKPVTEFGVQRIRGREKLRSSCRVCNAKDAAKSREKRRAKKGRINLLHNSFVPC